jgi:hypothetical protein
MLTIVDRSGPLCDGWSRREMIRAGSLASLGLVPWSAAQAVESSRRTARARSCILLFLVGGPPHQSLWDLKPEAPAEVRGEIGPIDTTVPGLQLGALLPETARWAQHLAILRAVSTNDNAHSSSGYAMLTGQPHVPLQVENANPGAPNNWPTLGAVVQHLARGPRLLPPAVRLPMHIFNTDQSVWPGQDSGWLGASADPWLLRCEPATPGFRIPHFHLAADVPLGRLESRRSLLEQLESQLRAAERASGSSRYDVLREQALGLLSQKQAREACALDLEPDGVRDRYGRHQFGQSVLLARRLVEAGVQFVQVNWFRGPEEPSDAPVWDTHVNETHRLKTVLVPPFDQAFSALLEDLHRRGRLDDTLVVVAAEFGRTPRFNGRAGRDHWGHVFSVVLAGGGIRGGVVHGATDRDAAYPVEGLVTPPDLTATLFDRLGIPPHTEIRDPLNRPMVISRGEPITPILA